MLVLETITLHDKETSKNGKCVPIHQICTSEEHKEEIKRHIRLANNNQEVFFSYREMSERDKE